MSLQERAPSSTRRLNQWVINSSYQANIAVETDWEFYSAFLGAPDPKVEAIHYLASLIGCYLRLWDTPYDPWQDTSNSGAVLDELQAYWNANMAAQKRTVVYMASGKGLSSGVAFMNGGNDNLQWSTACDSHRSPGRSNDYAICGYVATDSGGGLFKWNGLQSSNPAAMSWDIMLFANATMAGKWLQVDTCTSSGDTLLTVLVASSPGGRGNWTACGGDDDGCGTTAGPFKMNFQLTGNWYYFFLVGPHSNLARPKFSLRISNQGPSPPPSPKPRPPPPRPPPAAPQGSWGNPVVVANGVSGLPYMSAPISAFQPALPVNCSQYASNGRPAYTFQWFSGAAVPSGAKLVINSCGTTTGGMVPSVSVRSSSAANAGPYTCLGYSSSGCGAGVPGFRLVLASVPRNTYFRIAVHPVSTAPAGASVRLKFALQLPQVVG
ncbi:Cytochrome c554 [Chlorella sorokiniana]|uniref:Cytochrome c554 n=1 Tax=Chlorella sorokiniana TaxID=3076 RepID=A0A2P6TEV8_CHLSO|nr:Cytochrome c554 [Chlorella sorokiniana]|eukprot:PRW32508.1 Cytochrome c554 [Chlorella sorokiniana]